MCRCMTYSHVVELENGNVYMFYIALKEFEIEFRISPPCIHFSKMAAYSVCVVNNSSIFGDLFIDKSHIRLTVS